MAIEGVRGNIHARLTASLSLFTAVPATKNEKRRRKNSTDTHCPSGYSDECPDGRSCYGGLKCNVKDLMEAAEEEEATTVVAASRMDRDHPKHHNFCGASWGDASEKCGQW